MTDACRRPRKADRGRVGRAGTGAAGEPGCQPGLVGQESGTSHAGGRASPPRRAPPPAAGPSAHLQDLEKSIARNWAVRVQVRSSSKKGKGRLVIHYGSLDQFDQLLQRLGVADGIAFGARGTIGGKSCFPNSLNLRRSADTRFLNLCTTCPPSYNAVFKPMSDSSAQPVSDMSEDRPRVDVAIIGGAGPTGLFASFYAGLRQMSVKTDRLAGHPRRPTHHPVPREVHLRRRRLPEGPGQGSRQEPDRPGVAIQRHDVPRRAGAGPRAFRLREVRPDPQEQRRPPHRTIIIAAGVGISTQDAPAGQGRAVPRQRACTIS